MLDLLSCRKQGRLQSNARYFKKNMIVDFAHVNDACFPFHNSCTGVWYCIGYLQGLYGRFLARCHRRENLPERCVRSLPVTYVFQSPLICQKSGLLSSRLSHYLPLLLYIADWLNAVRCRLCQSEYRTMYIHQSVTRGKYRRVVTQPM